MENQHFKTHNKQHVVHNSCSDDNMIVSYANYHPIRNHDHSRNHLDLSFRTEIQSQRSPSFISFSELSGGEYLNKSSSSPIKILSWLSTSRYGTVPSFRNIRTTRRVSIHCTRPIDSTTQTQRPQCQNHHKIKPKSPSLPSFLSQKETHPSKSQPPSWSKPLIHPIANPPYWVFLPVSTLSR